MSFSLRNFDLAAMLRCGRDLRLLMQDARSMEEAAGAVVRHFRASCVDPETGEEECVLARFYKTHDYGALEPGLQAFARGVMRGAAPADATRCLVLLATAGEEPAWNDRRRSRGHQAIPLPSVRVMEEAPMISQLVRELGLDLHDVVAPRPEVVRGLEGKTFNVFYVAEARGSSAIPAQDDFVRPYGVRSVVGCGGMLITGEFFALILFSRVPVPAESADRFRNIALDLKLAISRFERIFDADPEAADKAADEAEPEVPLPDPAPG